MKNFQIHILYSYFLASQSFESFLKSYTALGSRCWSYCVSCGQYDPAHSIDAMDQTVTATFKAYHPRHVMWRVLHHFNQEKNWESDVEVRNISKNSEKTSIIIEELLMNGQIFRKFGRKRSEASSQVVDFCQCREKFECLIRWDFRFDPASEKLAVV